MSCENDEQEKKKHDKLEFTFQFRDCHSDQSIHDDNIQIKKRNIDATKKIV